MDRSGDGSKLIRVELGLIIWVEMGQFGLGCVSSNFLCISNVITMI